MNSYQERNEQIRRIREAGDSLPEIALALDLPIDSVRRIVHKFETEAVLSSRRSRFLENIRNVDDPDKKWKVSYMIQALALVAEARTNDGFAANGN